MTRINNGELMKINPPELGADAIFKWLARDGALRTKLAHPRQPRQNFHGAQLDDVGVNQCTNGLHD